MNWLGAVRDWSSDGPFTGVKRHLVDIAPAPVLPGLERFHDGMTRQPEMGGGVLVLRAVTTAHVPAGHAQPEVEPRVAEAQAVFTTVSAWLDHFDLAEMGATGHVPDECTTLGRYAEREVEP